MLLENKSTASLPGSLAGDHPPPYTPSPSDTLALVRPSLPAQNHLHIRRDNGSINGSYLIDASLPGGSGSNMTLVSHNGSVDARVYLAGEVKGRVLLEASSHNGSVVLTVCDRPSALPFTLHAVSHNGHVEAWLPDNFQGPLTLRTKNGSMTIVKPLARHVRILEETPGERRCWVGEGWEDEKDWIGDECVVESRNGSVSVGTWEGGAAQDEEEEKKKGGGWGCGWAMWCL